MKRLAQSLILLMLLISQAAAALATIDFMKMKTSEQMDVVKPIMLSFLQSGCKKVPDNSYTLVSAIEKLAYAKGYTYQSVETVAKEAALGLGMIC